jgi:Zn-dependent protease with chaperone function
MGSRTRLMGIILGVPLIGLTVAEVIQAYYGPLGDVRLLSKAAVAAGVFGVFVLLVIKIAGTLAQANRWLLLCIFKPGLYLTAIAIVALVLIHAALAMATIFYAEVALNLRIHIGVILAIGLGALGGVIIIPQNVFAVLRKAETLVIGRAVSRNGTPDLWRRVEGIADCIGALYPENIVIGLDPNFFVTEANVKCLSGSYNGRTLYCSLPLMRILSLQELDAVVGHELGHFKGLDTRFSHHFFPIYRGVANSIAQLQETGGEGYGSAALLPAIAVFGFFLESFSIAESRISRDRELLADKQGAAASDSEIMASALVKVHAFSGLWGYIEQAAERALKNRNLYVNMSKTYAEVVANNAKPELLTGLADTHLSHRTDSHPPLDIRLRSLATSIDKISMRALTVYPTKAAIELVSEAEEAEERISSTYQ